MAVEAEVLLGGGEADEDGVVDFGGEDGGFEDAGEVEPHAAEPNALPWVEAVDTEQLCGLGAEDRDGLMRGRRVQVAALGERRADRAREVEARGLDGEGVRVDGRDERALVDVGLGEAGLLHLLDRADSRDHPAGSDRELGGLSEQGLAVGDGEQVGSELVDLGEQAGL